jgi:hypothetical protein
LAQLPPWQTKRVADMAAPERLEVGRATPAHAAWWCEAAARLVWDTHIARLAPTEHGGVKLWRGLCGTPTLLTSRPPICPCIACCLPMLCLQLPCDTRHTASAPAADRGVGG